VQKKAAMKAFIQQFELELLQQANQKIREKNERDKRCYMEVDAKYLVRRPMETDIKYNERIRVFCQILTDYLWGDLVDYTKNNLPITRDEQLFDFLTQLNLWEEGRREEDVRIHRLKSKKRSYMPKEWDGSRMNLDSKRRLKNYMDRISSGKRGGAIVFGQNKTVFFDKNKISIRP
jgi:hypothetical protein